jgi:uncharacterized membrane protein YcaP (DUF421 family)
MSCRYSGIFGEPGKGVHSIRLFNVAVVDVVCTIILAIITNKLIYGLKGTYYSLTVITIIWFILGIILHKLFCVKTTIDKVIFGN